MNLDKLHRMQQYAEADICRRRILLNYFGENMECSCGNCDVCKNPPEHFDGSILVQKALSAIIRANEQISTHLLIDVLRGNYTPEIVKKQFDKLKTFGAGRDVPARDWQDYLLQMLQLGYFEIAYNEENHLKATASGKKVLYGTEKAQLVVIKRDTPAPKPKGKRKKTDALIPKLMLVSQEESDEKLFEELRAYRKQLADMKHDPAYIILNDKVLRQLSSLRPTTLEAFGEINGIGTYKRDTYGEGFIKLIKKHVD